MGTLGETSRARHAAASDRSATMQSPFNCAHPCPTSISPGTHQRRFHCLDVSSFRKARVGINDFPSSAAREGREPLPLNRFLPVPNFGKELPSLPKVHPACQVTRMLSSQNLARRFACISILPALSMAPAPGSHQEVLVLFEFFVGLLFRALSTNARTALRAPIQA
jgi:hypothetical protein